MKSKYSQKAMFKITLDLMKDNPADTEEKLRALYGGDLRNTVISWNLGPWQPKRLSNG